MKYNDISYIWFIFLNEKNICDVYKMIVCILLINVGNVYDVYWKWLF